jgi:hypothetical protein
VLQKASLPTGFVILRRTPASLEGTLVQATVVRVALLHPWLRIQRRCLRVGCALMLRQSATLMLQVAVCHGANLPGWQSLQNDFGAS